MNTDEGDLASQQGKRKAAPDEAEEGLSETEGRHILTQHCCLRRPTFFYMCMHFIHPPLASVRSAHAVQPLRKFPDAGGCRICEVHRWGECTHISNKVPMCLQASQASGKLLMKSLTSNFHSVALT